MQLATSWDGPKMALCSVNPLTSRTLFHTHSLSLTHTHCHTCSHILSHSHTLTHSHSHSHTLSLTHTQGSAMQLATSRDGPKVALCPVNPLTFISADPRGAIVFTAESLVLVFAPQAETIIDRRSTEMQRGGIGGYPPGSEP